MLDIMGFNDKIVNLMDSVIDKMKTPAETLPTILLDAVSIKRPGLSPSKITAEIISNNNIIGLPTGDNPDGSPNLINQYTYNVVKGIVDAIKEDAVVQVAIPKESILVETKGGNAGGPLVGIGSNIISTTIKGIIR